MNQLAAGALALIFVAAPAPAQNTASPAREGREEESVLAVVRRTTDALRHNNADELSAELADDYSFTGTRGNLLNKSGQVAAIREGRTHYDAISTSDERVRMFKDVAVVTLVRHQKGRTSAGPLADDVRAIQVYEHRQGRWLLVVSQQTIVLQ